MGVPVPYRGYWARKVAGQMVSRTPLSKARPEYPTEHTFDIPSVPLFESLVEQQTVPIIVPTTLTDPHPHIVTTEHTWRALIPAAETLLFSKDKPILDMTVSEQQLDRALRVMDTIIKTTNARGDTLEICDARGACRRTPRFAH
jgi:hypothetical protein